MLNLSGEFNVESRKAPEYVHVAQIAREGEFKPSEFHEIRTGQYDFVVLQVVAAVKVPPAVMKESREVIRQMCRKISESGATPVIYEHFLPDAVVERPDGARYQFGKKDQDEITQLCVQAAAEDDARLAPCGATWWTVFDSKEERDELRKPNDIFHANLRGNYLLACCIYAAKRSTLLQAG